MESKLKVLGVEFLGWVILWIWILDRLRKFQNSVSVENLFLFFKGF